MGVLGLDDKQFIELAQGASYTKADGTVFTAPHHGIYFDDTYKASEYSDASIAEILLKGYERAKRQGYSASEDGFLFVNSPFHSAVVTNVDLENRVITVEPNSRVEPNVEAGSLLGIDPSNYSLFRGISPTQRITEAQRHLDEVVEYRIQMQHDIIRLQEDLARDRITLNPEGENNE